MMRLLACFALRSRGFRPACKLCSLDIKQSKKKASHALNQIRFHHQTRAWHHPGRHVTRSLGYRKAIHTLGSYPSLDPVQHLPPTTGWRTLLQKRSFQKNVADSERDELGRENIFSYKNFEDHLFDILSGGNGKVSLGKILAGLRAAGLWQNDPRLRESMQKIRNAQQLAANEPDGRELILDRDSFNDLIKENIVLIRRAFTADFVIPDFTKFCETVDDLYWMCRTNTDGKVASYIPQLSRYSSDYWGVSLCTIDGQRHSIGDVNVPFSIQSCSKPVNYALTLNELGHDVVHQYIGHEPSGESFNHIKLSPDNKPHNPMINAGAIVVASLIKNNLRLADRFDYASNQYRKLTGGEYLGFNNAIFLSERETADRNFALAYYLKENKCFPDGMNLHETMDFYFQLCSIEINCDSGAVLAATFANGGFCPITGEQVLDATSVRNTLSLMHSCGMYDYSGEFAFKVGLPAKSGVSGVILLVIPNVAGICLWSPPLDKCGNSVRGIQFSEDAVRLFNFHHYDNLKHTARKQDPRIRKTELQGTQVVKLLFGAYNGDLSALRRMALAEQDLSIADYDGRTALHLAAAEGHLECVKFLLEKCRVPPYPKDRWGHMPIDDAIEFKRTKVLEYLKEYEVIHARESAPVVSASSMMSAMEAIPVPIKDMSAESDTQGHSDQEEDQRQVSQEKSP